MELSLKDFLENINNFIPGDVKIICVAGGSGSGKSFLAKQIAEKISVKILTMDDYIIPREITGDSNWDLPRCWDLKLLDANLGDFLKGKKFKKPIYDFKKGVISEYEIIGSGNKLIIEGLYALHDSIISHVDFSIFVESPEDVRLARVVKRDFLERSKHSEVEITKRWNETIQPTFLEYIDSQKEKADLIILN